MAERYPRCTHGLVACPKCPVEPPRSDAPPLQGLIEVDADELERALPADNDLGLSLDMLDADRLRQWAQNLLTYGPDISHWASVPFVVGKLQKLATGIEHAVRDIGRLRALPTGEQERARLRGEAVMADAHRRSELMAETCEWKRTAQIGGGHITSCGEATCVLRPYMKFCFNCGKPLREVPYGQ